MLAECLRRVREAIALRIAPWLGPEVVVPRISSQTPTRYGAWQRAIDAWESLDPSRRKPVIDPEAERGSLGEVLR